MRILESAFLVFALVGGAMGVSSSMASVKEASRGLSFKLKRTIVDRPHPSKIVTGKRPREVSRKRSAHSRHVGGEDDHSVVKHLDNRRGIFKFHKGVFWDYFDEMYSTTLGIGSNNKQFTVVLDLESADFWVPGSGCVTSGCAGRQTLGTTDSTTLNVGTTQWTAGYINGDVTGVYANDTVNFANFTLENVAFGLASQVDLGVTNGWYDGLLGLAFQNAGLLEIPNIWNDLVSAGLLDPDDVQFGLHLQRANNGVGDWGGISFGILDSDFYSVEPVRVPNLSDQGLWQIAVSNTLVNGNQVTFPTVSGTSTRTTVLSTTSPYFIMSYGDADALHAALSADYSTDGQGNYFLPCDLNVDLAFVFGGDSFTINPLDYIGGVVQDGSVNKCQSMIQGDARSDVSWKMGTGLLRNVYTAFYYSLNAVGFAHLSI